MYQPAGNCPQPRIKGDPLSTPSSIFTGIDLAGIADVALELATTERVCRMCHQLVGVGDGDDRLHGSSDRA
jgi:hypothetical protein